MLKVGGKHATVKCYTQNNLVPTTSEIKAESYIKYLSKQRISNQHQYVCLTVIGISEKSSASMFILHLLIL